MASGGVSLSHKALPDEGSLKGRFLSLVKGLGLQEPLLDEKKSTFRLVWAPMGPRFSGFP